MYSASAWRARSARKRGKQSVAPVTGATEAGRKRRQQTTLPFDDHVLDRHVLVEALVAGAHGADLVDHVHAFDDLAEDTVAPALAGRRAEVQEVVIDGVDEELGGRRVRIAGARHRDRAALVLQAVGRLVLDRLAGVLLVHARLEAAALDHEVADHAVEDGVVVMPGLDVGNEVGRGLRGLFGVQFEGDDAVVGGQLDHWGVSFIFRR
jgi:hypothetical protein